MWMRGLAFCLALHGVAALCPAQVAVRGETVYTDARFEPGDLLLFGPETRGLPDAVLASLPPSQVLRIPMVSYSRSINLSNAVAVALFEAWRQQSFRTV